MIEIPEAVNLSRQILKKVKGKEIASVVAGLSPYKFAWYNGDPGEYEALLRGKTVDSAMAWGGMLEIHIGDAVVLFSDGVVLRFHSEDEQVPKKHQLLIEFEDTTAVTASVQMYGGLWCFKEGKFDNDYYIAAKSKPSPLSDAFDKEYFDHLISSQDIQKLSIKAFLATEQRIPGFGNGVLQDILYIAKIHPRRKIEDLDAEENVALFASIKSTLREMTEQGGRDTEKDLFGKPGGYRTRLSKNTIGDPCPLCRGKIIKQSYMGGSIYFCDGCQKI